MRMHDVPTGNIREHVAAAKKEAAEARKAEQAIAKSTEEQDQRCREQRAAIDASVKRLDKEKAELLKRQETQEAQMRSRQQLRQKAKDKALAMDHQLMVAEDVAAARQAASAKVKVLERELEEVRADYALKESGHQREVAHLTAAVTEVRKLAEMGAEQLLLATADASQALVNLGEVGTELETVEQELALATVHNEQLAAALFSLGRGHVISSRRSSVHSSATVSTPADPVISRCAIRARPQPHLRCRTRAALAALPVPCVRSHAQPLIAHPRIGSPTCRTCNLVSSRLATHRATGPS